MEFTEFFNQAKRQGRLKTVVNTFASTGLFDFKIVHFQDRTHKDPKPRYWVTFKIEDDTFCFLTSFTSQDTLARLYRNNDNALNSLVFISSHEFNPPLTKDSFLDCNIQDAKHRRTFSELSEKIIDWKIGIKEINYPIPEDIKKRIIRAIVNSNFTSPEIIDGFKRTYPELVTETNT